MKVRLLNLPKIREPAKTVSTGGAQPLGPTDNNVKTRWLMRKAPSGVSGRTCRAVFKISFGEFRISQTR
jgi:hypothetical protein